MGKFQNRIQTSVWSAVPTPFRGWPPPRFWKLVYNMASHRYVLTCLIAPPLRTGNTSHTHVPPRPPNAMSAKILSGGSGDQRQRELYFGHHCLRKSSHVTLHGSRAYATTRAHGFCNTCRTQCFQHCVRRTTHKGHCCAASIFIVLYSIPSNYA